MEEIVDMLIKPLIEEVFKEGKGWLKSISDDTKQFLKVGLKEYLKKQKDKYSYVKTLLQGNTPIFLYDIYYPLKLYGFEKEGYLQKRVEIDAGVKALKKDCGNFITIIGDAGSGKSMLIKHLFLNSIDEAVGIPILVELRYLNYHGKSIEDYIVEKIFENSISENSEILEKLFKKGKFIFFLDGFDELGIDIKNETIISLNSFINKHNKNLFIMTSRPYANIELLPLFHNVYINRLSKDDVNKFIVKQLKNESELAEKIISILETNQYQYISSFLSNPLLLSLYILTFQSNSDIPSKKYIFYRRVVSALFSEHDSKTKLGFKREKLSKLTQESIEEVLKRFCLRAYFENKTAFDRDYVSQKLTDIKNIKKDLVFDNNLFIEDMLLSIALWVEDGNLLSFSHKSLQEYFVALYIWGLKEEQKQKFYEKIYTDTKLSKITEIRNLLSLCEEMDEIDFIRFFKVPVLNIISNRFSNKNKDELIRDIVALLHSNIVITNPSRYSWSSSYNYRLLNLVGIEAKELLECINKTMVNETTKNTIVKYFIPYDPPYWEYVDSNGQYPEEMLYIDLTKSFPNELLGIFKESDLLNKISEINNLVSQQIKLYESKIENSINSDDELISMI